MERHRTARLLAVLVAVLALAACGDDDDGGGGGGGTGGGDATGHDVTISGSAFDPATLTVAAGDTVDVTNEDDFAHTFTSDEAGFDLEIDGGGSGTVEVDAEPGSYEFVCTIHPSMQGTITVE